MMYKRVIKMEEIDVNDYTKPASSRYRGHSRKMSKINRKKYIANIVFQLELLTYTTSYQAKL